ncbi:uncharacterized protein, partial [Parasteatoda tepidariorum]|uniref:uncharacterized protein n=1 Tax=Parasteatoda tepidariorum TaxID=114398 RepID=UPI001C728177
MVYMCCVPMCRGNYDEDHKVSVFRFPQDAELQQLWLRKIPRKNYKITAHSRVCEKHFRAEDIRREASHFDERTGRHISYTLDRPVLEKEAVPCLFQNCPSYLSSASSSRESPSAKKQKIEELQLAEALKASEEAACLYAETNSFDSLSKLKMLLGDKVLPKNWHALFNGDKQVNFLNFSDEDVPNVLYVVTVYDNLCLHVSFKGQKLLKHDGKKLPLAVGQINDIFDTLERLEKQQIDSKDPITYYLEIVESLLTSLKDIVEDKHKVSLDFILEQLNFLMCKPERFRYSSNTLILSCLLFYISPQAYKFLRQSGTLTLPDPSTLRKISAKLHTTPQHEQCDSMFLMYAKQMISSLQEEQRYVSLMLDEIHIQPYLDYKGGNM